MVSLRRRVATVVGLALAGSGTLVLGAGSAAAVATTQETPEVAPCPEPLDPVEPTTQDEAEALIVGTWIRCGDGVLLPPSGAGDDIGIEFRADGTWHRLYEEDGALVRAGGLEEEGRWTTRFDAPPAFQLNITILGSGSVFTSPTVHRSTPTLLQTPGMLDMSAAFVAWTGDPPTTRAPAGPDEGPCESPTGEVELESVAQVEELLVGTWIRCGRESAIGPVRPGELGIDITADGRFYRLYDDGEGGLVRAVRGSEDGTWEVLDNTGAEWPGGYQLDLNHVGTTIGHVTFLEQPTHFRFVGVPSADYQAWTGPPPVSGEPPQTALASTGPIGGATAGLTLVVAGLVLVVLGRRLDPRPLPRR